MAFSRVVQARVSGEIQDAANAVIQAYGLTVSDVVRALMIRIAQDQRIPPTLFRPTGETLTSFAGAGRGGRQRFADLRAED